jgi:ketosteroid isomerase-like protein
MLKFTVVSLTSLFLLAGCNTAPPAPAIPAVDIAAEQGKIRDLETAWAKDAAAKDLDKSVANYADDAILNGKLAFSTERVEVSASGDLATSKGSYTMTMTNPKTKKPVEDKGSYLTVYKKQADGNWKAIEDTTSSEVAPK